MNPCEDYSHIIVIPMVENVHQAIVAFLQTSDHGIWQLDNSRPNNQFTIHFIRGNWERSFFGLGNRRVAAACDVDAHGSFIPRTKPMQLEVTLRPSPENIRIGLRHSVFAKREVPRRDRRDYLAYWNGIVRSEIDSLRHYLSECYNLDRVPSLEHI